MLLDLLTAPWISLGPLELSVAAVALIVLAAFCAGWIDAVVGGGGLLQLPAILLLPGITPVQALATSKLASIAGTATSSITFARRARPDIRTVVPMAIVALGGAVLGAAVATILPSEVFKPIIVVALLVVAIVTVARPTLGAEMALRFSGPRHHITAGAIGLVIGFYDGLLGPGTGTFLVISLVGFLGYDFLQASAKAKMVNFATNLGALLLFVPSGSVLWLLGAILAVANIAGSYLGSRMAVARGSRFIRIVFLVVVGALLLKLGFDVWSENIQPILG